MVRLSVGFPLLAFLSFLTTGALAHDDWREKGLRNVRVAEQMFQISQEMTGIPVGETSKINRIFGKMGHLNRQ